jgi:hypothetical protein
MNGMKYWGYLAAKLALVAVIVFGLHFLVWSLFPPPPLTRYGRIATNFLWSMPYTFSILAVWLVGAGLLSFVVRDQRQRCRTCLRRLIMPVASGSWGNILRLGRPMTEWICPFGHGTLRVDNLQITGSEGPDWEPHHDDIWKELESYYQTRK